MPPDGPALFTISVRDLVDFALRTGDLGGERDFVGPQRALAGIRGHQKLQKSRPAGYQKEVSLAHEVDAGAFRLRVEGRVDGMVAGEAGLWLEEIKTVRGGWDGAADPLHWAQVRCYARMLLPDHPVQAARLQLTYLDLDNGAVTELGETVSAADLVAFFDATVAIYLDWLRDWWGWRSARDESLGRVAFPFDTYRPGQREMAVAVYRALTRGQRLFAEAPTGIGKTVSALFPAVKALGEGKAGRVFYLTARTTGRAVAVQALADLRRAGARLRGLTLTAREKVCVREGRPCDPRTCPMALGYYDRHKAAMREALRRQELTRADLEEVGGRHQVCPFELALDLSLWVDVVVGDYNHVFDPRAYLRRHFDAGGGDAVFLIDEAHNLADRARSMFSADLDLGEIREVRRAIRTAVPRCARALSRLRGAIRQLAAKASGAALGDGDAGEASEPDLFNTPALEAREAPEAPEAAPGVVMRGGLLAWRGAPEAVAGPLEDALRHAEAWLAGNRPADFRESLLQLYFRLFAFRRTLDLFGSNYVTLLHPGRDARLELFCLDPSPLVREALGRGRAAVFFSATLTPLDYYRDVLGGEAGDPQLRLASPFPPERLAVLVQDRLRTQWKDRAATAPAVAGAIDALIRERRGNYLVYLPSYEYLQVLHEQFQALCPGAQVLAQRPGMSEAEREEFLAAFAVEHSETRVGFAVLGGVFGEGIDLVGDRLIGAAVVGVGLPQLCAERDLILDYYQERLGSGFDYAYTFPGMNRVLQAIGRVIRSESDRGVVLLIDTRFAEPRYRALFPPGWRPRRTVSTGQIQEAARAFWEDSAPGQS